MCSKLINITKGVDGLFIKNERFKTTLISVNMYMPLDKDKISSQALLPYLLTSCSAEYDNFTKLNKQLDMLYGAELSVVLGRAGDTQQMKIAVSAVNNEYSLNGEDIISDAAGLLSSLIFRPRLNGNAFYTEDVEREKRITVENIRGEINDKRVYAKNRMLSEMFKDDPYGVSKYGTEKDVAAATGESLYNTWVDVLSHSYVRIQVVGKQLPDGLFQKIGGEFDKFNRTGITDCKNVRPVRNAEKVNVSVDEMDVAQGKLVMGFSSDLYGDNEASLSVATDIFGGGPYSMLFENVREKMSLCYYCSAMTIRSKGLVMVQSGVEKSNFDKAEKEIINQLETVKNGKFDKFAFNASIKALSGSMDNFYDSLGMLDSWYSSRVFGTIVSPKEYAEKIKNVTVDDVIKTAGGFKLHTVYKLVPMGTEVTTND